MTSVTYVGLDVHKASISVALADEGRSEPRFYGKIAPDAASLALLCGKLAASGSGRRLHFCDEAGPCGYGAQRTLRSLGHACDVVAPSLIPRKPGDKVKTDRRDAMMLARLLRAGELTAVWSPDEAHEAMRDLVRARNVARRALTKARQSLQGFLLRHGRVFSGRKNWTKAYRRWLSTLAFPHPAQQIVFQYYIHTIEDQEKRVARLDAQIEALAPNWSLAPVVAALQALRGVRLLTAATLVAEIGDVTRFARPAQLMAYLGLTPGEETTGERRRLGAITKAGDGAARRALVEAAWSYRWPARVGRGQVDRLEDQPQAVRDIAWKAQIRLSEKYRKLVAAGKRSTVAVVAVARELCGFVWALAREAMTPQAA